MKFKMKGLDNVLRNMRSVRDNLPQQAEAALQAEADSLVGKVRDRVPVASGILRDSFTTVKETKRNKVVIHIMTDVDYAPYVHENLEAQHNVGEAKFMESVMDEAEPHVLRAVARRINLKKAIK